MYAEGVQIYRWNGTSWIFVAPEALLFADADGNGVVGIHYGGPTWESNSGSKVVGMVLERCTPDPDAIPWLLLKAVSNEGPGPFQRVTFIQRVNTVGGLAPTDAGDFVGEEARVPYTTEYYFYRASGNPNELRTWSARRRSPDLQPLARRGQAWRRHAVERLASGTDIPYRRSCSRSEALVS